jgi:hypothetical protein
MAPTDETKLNPKEIIMFAAITPNLKFLEEVVTEYIDEASNQDGVEWYLLPEYGNSFPEVVADIRVYISALDRTDYPAANPDYIPTDAEIALMLKFQLIDFALEQETGHPEDFRKFANAQKTSVYLLTMACPISLYIRMISIAWNHKSLSLDPRTGGLIRLENIIKLALVARGIYDPIAHAQVLNGMASEFPLYPRLTNTTVMKASTIYSAINSFFDCPIDGQGKTWLYWSLA